MKEVTACLFCATADTGEKLLSLSDDILAALYWATKGIDNPRIWQFRGLVGTLLGLDALYGPDRSIDCKRPVTYVDRHGHTGGTFFETY